MHNSFGDLLAHTATGRLGRFIVSARRFRTDGAWMYFVGDGRPRWIPQQNLRPPAPVAEETTTDAR